MKATRWRCAEQIIIASQTVDGLYIGLLSGTSADGVDAALVEIVSGKVVFNAAATRPYEERLRNKLLSLNESGAVSLPDLVRLNREIATVFADTASELIESAGGASAIVAIGSHGQTIFHNPDGLFPGTIQLGDASVIAQATGVDTVADFRSADMACGGQGAPLTPAFNNAVFRTDQPRVILNLGGIANLTFLGEDTLGFDTGPANTLLDAWIKRHKNQPCDLNGNWAKTGVCNDALLLSLQSDPFFAKEPPKSTGPDYFNLTWLKGHLETLGREQVCEPKDVQATLVELTATTVARSILQSFPGGVEILLCGGGSHNAYLVERLEALCRPCSVSTTQKSCGMHVDHCESIAFAWLAYQYMNAQPGNLPAVTGASKAVVLGALHKAP